MPDNSVKITIILATIGAILGLAIGGLGGLFVGAGIMYAFSVIFHIIQNQVQRNTEIRDQKELTEGENLKKKLFESLEEKKTENTASKNIFDEMLIIEETPEKRRERELSIPEYKRRFGKK